MTHKARVLSYLLDNGSITSWEAIKEFGNTRLSATIYLLRQDGYQITSRYEKGKNKYGDNISWVRYYIEGVEE